MKTYRIRRIRPGNQNYNSRVSSGAKGDSCEDALTRYASGPYGDLVQPDVPGRDQQDDLYLVSEIRRTRSGDNSEDQGEFRLLKVTVEPRPKYQAVLAV